MPSLYGQSTAVGSHGKRIRNGLRRRSGPTRTAGRRWASADLPRSFRCERRSVRSSSVRSSGSRRSLFWPSASSSTCCRGWASNCWIPPALSPSSICRCGCWGCGGAIHDDAGRARPYHALGHPIFLRLPTRPRGRGGKGIGFGDRPTMGTLN